MKTCFKCKRELPRTDFYKHPQMADGLLGKCKDCTQDDVAEHRIKNVGRIRQYDRVRSTEPHRAEMRSRVAREWREAHPDWRRAQVAVGNAIRRKQLVRPDHCQRCNVIGRIEAHHADYSKPLEVEWLCKPCHAIADKERRETAA